MREWTRACLAGESPGDLGCRTILPDGTVRLLNGRGGLERDANGKPVRMIGTVRALLETGREHTA